MRQCFSKWTKEKLRKDNKSILLLGDIGVGSFLKSGDDLVDRAFNLGINEQAMISCAAGLADQGHSVYVHTISAFLIERAYEQIKLNCAYNGLKLILIAANGPFDYEKLGPTHFSASDVPLINTLGLNILLPTNDEQVATALELATDSDQSSYIRLTSRGSDLRFSKPSKGIYASLENANRSHCIIALGEAVKYVTERGLDKKVDVFQILDLNTNLDHLMSKYCNVTFLEPYSHSILMPKYGTLGVNYVTFDCQFKKEICANKGWDSFDRQLKGYI